MKKKENLDKSEKQQNHRNKKKEIVLIVLTIKPMEIGRATERWTLPIQNHSPIKKKQQNLMKKMFAATSDPNVWTASHKSNFFCVSIIVIWLFFFFFAFYFPTIFKSTKRINIYK